jgi:hypothetical protein
MSCIDPFGAPEFLVDGVAYRIMVGTEMIRFAFHSEEEEGRILRLKLVFPVAQLFETQNETRLFVARNECRRAQMAMLAH